MYTWGDYTLDRSIQKQAVNDPKVHHGQQAAEEGIPAPCALWRPIAQRMPHALGGAPSRCDLRSNSDVTAGPPRSPRKWRRFHRSQPPTEPRGLVWMCVRRHSAGTQGAHKSGDSFADRNPQGAARSSLGVRKTSLCWAFQEPTKVATVSQIAAPQGAARSSLGVRKTPLRWTPQEPTEVATVSQIAAPPGSRAV